MKDEKRNPQYNSERLDYDLADRSDVIDRYLPVIQENAELTSSEIDTKFLKRSHT